MSVTYERAKQIASACETLSTKLKTDLKSLEQLLDTNSDMAIDWGNALLQPPLLEDADGNLQGLKYSRQDVSNVIGTFDQIRKLLRNLPPSQGNHLGNLDKLASVIT